MDFTTPTKYLAMLFLLMPALQSCEYYADGIGEVYYHYPYPVSGMYGAIDGFIIKPE